MLSADLRRGFPDMAGLSALNLWRMRAFYVAYGGAPKLSQAVTESESFPERKLRRPASESRADHAVALQAPEQMRGPKLSQPVTESCCCYGITGFAALGAQHRADAKS